MAFKVYTSNDANAPALMGTSGSLLAVLDACLVTGYGSMPAAGWLKPIPNDTFRGCFQQPSGSGMVLFVNDAAPSGSAATGVGITREAWVTGYASITGLTGSSVGTGTGQFPQLSQLLADTRVPPSGSFIWKKSSTIDSASRQWTVVADDRTMYIFIANGDTVNIYGGGGFGDIYSLAGSSDTKKCMIWGRPMSFSATNGGWDCSDLIFSPDATVSSDVSLIVCNSPGGKGQPVIMNKVGDMGKQLPVSRTTTGPTATTSGIFAGGIPSPNPIDNCLYLYPIYLSEVSIAGLRGRLRGMFMLLHQPAGFSNGQTFAGTNEYAGKTFLIIKSGPSLGMWIIETSNTVETN